MDLDADPRLEQLVADLAWVRRLARALVKDDAIADDLAQDAYLVAAEKAPADRPLRPWLGRVVLNLVRMRGRSTKRRAARELATSEAALAVPSPEELVARVQTQQVVAAEVLALAEPYRATVRLHYVEELSSAEIARRLGILDATVRRRLKHARDELRARLTAHDDAPRRGSLAALAPLAKGAAPSPASTVLVGGLVMGTDPTGVWFANTERSRLIDNSLRRTLRSESIPHGLVCSRCKPDPECSSDARR
jgi:RNA polymerase sigma-70 factor (ECF subfamily)